MKTETEIRQYLETWLESPPCPSPWQAETRGRLLAMCDVLGDPTVKAVVLDWLKRAEAEAA